MQIENDHWVTVRYRLYDSDGEPIEDGERELTYLQGGYGTVFPRVEQALAGREPGYQASLYLQPDDTFGDYDAGLVRLAPRADFPESIEIGMTFEGVPGEDDASDDERLYVVTDFTGDVVVLDGNHPLAGMALRFDVRVLAVRAATPAEVERERERAAAEAGDGPGDDDEEDEGEWDDGDEGDEGGLEAPGRADDPESFGRVAPHARRTLH